MRILIPSDNCDFVDHFVSAYKSAGCEVVTGTHNFDLRSARFDLVHYQWPEELSGWTPPSRARLKQISEVIDWWQERSPSIVTVHNIYPHGFEGNESYKELYTLFYERCSWMLHFSSASRNLVCQEFASARHERHVVCSRFNYD